MTGKLSSCPEAGKMLSSQHDEAAVIYSALWKVALI